MRDLSATERCVKCGLCLPHCPTFNLTGNEADSPRGRISLMQSMQRRPTDLSPGLFQHLDQCLQCHACESMCPSKVPFEALMDNARAQLETYRQRGMLNRLARKLGFYLITSSTARRFAAPALTGIQAMRLDRFLAGLPLTPKHIKRALRLLPNRQPRRLKRVFSAERSDIPRPRVQLFTGCTGDLFDRATLNATHRILDRLGYAIDVPAKQTCCGALHLHNGEPDKASQLAQTNISAFPGTDPVISIASGCQARLQNYTSQYHEAADLSGRVKDILDFLLAHGNAGLELKPVKATVAVHIPCTQRNALHQPQAAAEILAWIPELKIITLNPNGGCCGAAGSYMLSQPQMSEPLGLQMADAFIASGAQLLVTTNIGCSLQLLGALRARGMEVEIVHPVTLVERALG